MHRLRVLMETTAASSGLICAAWLSVGIRPVGPVFALMFAQMTGGATVPGSEGIMEFAIRQGGAFAILALVLFYYRRDYRALTAFQQEQINRLLEAMSTTAKVNAEVTAALRENTESLRELRRHPSFRAQQA